MTQKGGEWKQRCPLHAPWPSQFAISQRFCRRGLWRVTEWIFEKKISSARGSSVVSRINSRHSPRDNILQVQSKYPAIHTLVCNAGVWMPMDKQAKTEDGFEVNKQVCMECSILGFRCMQGWTILAISFLHLFFLADWRHLPLAGPCFNLKNLAWGIRRRENECEMIVCCAYVRRVDQAAALESRYSGVPWAHNALPPAPSSPEHLSWNHFYFYPLLLSVAAFAAFWTEDVVCIGCPKKRTFRLSTFANIPVTRVPREGRFLPPLIHLLILL